MRLNYTIFVVNTGSTLYFLAENERDSFAAILRKAGFRVMSGLEFRAQPN
jgi:hypothetical protein